MNLDYRTIVIYLHKKGYNPNEIQNEIDEVFGPHLYSYLAITYTLRKLSFGAEK